MEGGTCWSIQTSLQRCKGLEFYRMVRHKRMGEMSDNINLCRGRMVANIYGLFNLDVWGDYDYDPWKTFPHHSFDPWEGYFGFVTKFTNIMKKLKVGERKSHHQPDGYCIVTKID